LSTITKIQWTDHTFNPWVGCTKVSDLCRFCYAEVNTFTRKERARGRELWGPTAARHRTSQKLWDDVYKWDEAARVEGRRHKVFCASLADVAEDRPDLVPWRADLCDLIVDTPNLWWQLLTKRPQNLARLFKREALARSWVGYSGADPEGIRALLEAVPETGLRFLSLEPLLEPVDVRPFLRTVVMETQMAEYVAPGIDWVIVGGESGRHARPCDLEWIREVVGHCRTAGAPVFVKQLGARPYDHSDMCRGCPGCGTRECGAAYDLQLDHEKGGDPEEWPEWLRVREFPRCA